MRIVLALARSEEHTSELQSHDNLVCRLLLEKKTNTPPSDAAPPLSMRPPHRPLPRPPRAPATAFGRADLAQLPRESGRSGAPGRGPAGGSGGPGSLGLGLAQVAEGR